MDGSPRRSGFLYVVTAVLLLAGVAVVVQNLIAASPRNPISRVRSDQRSLATALEAYVIDANTYPAELWEVTTPMSYLAAIPNDALSPKPGRPFLYAPYNARPARNGPGTICMSWILVSRGPDGVFDIVPSSDLPADEPVTAEEAGQRLVGKTYDPTNGSNSGGDIYRLGGDAAPRQNGGE